MMKEMEDIEKSGANNETKGFYESMENNFTEGNMIQRKMNNSSKISGIPTASECNKPPIKINYLS